MIGLWLTVLFGCGEPPAPLPPPEPLEWTAVGEALKPVVADQACARGDGEACWWLGVHRRWSEPADLEGAWAAFSAGCDAGEVRSCEAAAVAHRLGEGTPTDLVRSRERYRKGCDAGSRSACLGAVRTGALIDDRDRCWGGEYEPSTWPCARACAAHGDAPICETARELLDHDCQRRDAQACTWLGRFTADPDEANRLLWRGCDLDDPWGCQMLADRIARGEGSNPSPKSLEWLLNQVCDIQLDYGCVSHQVSWLL